MFANHRVVRGRLENGLRVVTIELPHLHTATIAAYVKVGSRFESAAENGLSHFVEHMLYRGTEAYPSSYDLNFAFESLGSSLHAETGRDYSLYQVATRPELVGDALALFGELFVRPRFSDIELERELILEEMGEDYDERGNELNEGDIARGLLFGDHPLAQRIIGPRENVERFSDADVRRHFSRFYCAHNLILAVAGPVSAAEVEAAAARHLGALPAGREATGSSPRFEQAEPLFHYVADRGAQTSLNILWRAVPEQDPDYAATVALCRALDDGMATRLHYRLCDQLGLAYSLSAGLEPLHDVTLLEVSGATANAKVPELLRRLFELMDEFRREPIADAELHKVKRRYVYDLACTIDDPGAMVGWFGGTALYYEPQDLETRAATLQAVTAAEVQRVAERILAPERLCVVAVGSLSRAQISEIKEAIRGQR